MKKNEVKKVMAMAAELKSAGLMVSDNRLEHIIEACPSLADFFRTAFGITLNETLAGASLAVSLAETNKAIREANADGRPTTRTRLIRYLTDASFVARDGVAF